MVRRRTYLKLVAGGIAGTAVGTGTGAARVTQSGPGTESAKLAADDGRSLDNFAGSVAVSDGTVIIGAFGNDIPNDPETTEGDDTGSAYVFERVDGSWTQQARLTGEQTDRQDGFGRAVALDGDTALFGATGDEAGDLTDPSTGAAYVFTRSDGSWSQRTKLVPDDGAASDYFGWSLAADEDTLLVGAFNDENENGVGAGGVYVFDRSGGSLTREAKLTRTGESGSLPYRNDAFGSSVALNGGRALIGADDDEDPNGSVGEGGGSAYVFERSDGAWSQQRKLAASDGDADDGFGRVVALDGGTGIVGAPGDEDPNGDGAGSAYVFDVGSGSGNGSPSQAPDVTGDGNPAADPDGDGVYEDVNGDGDTTPGDATVLFNRIFDGDAAVTGNSSLFDFNGDGSLTPGDATVLFDEIF